MALYDTLFAMMDLQASQLLVTPRDFDLSPYFEIVKFSLIQGARVPAPEPKPSYARRAVAALPTIPLLSRFRRSPLPSSSPPPGSTAPATVVLADHALRNG